LLDIKKAVLWALTRRAMRAYKRTYGAQSMPRQGETWNSPLFEIAGMLVRFEHVAS
jgi:hypothetical protein